MGRGFALRHDLCSAVEAGKTLRNLDAANAEQGLNAALLSERLGVGFDGDLKPSTEKTNRDEEGDRLQRTPRPSYPWSLMPLCRVIGLRLAVAR